MRKSITFLSFIICGAATLFSCKKNDNITGTPMTANINGASYKSSFCEAIISGINLSISGVSASATATYPYIIISLSNYTGTPGTYPISVAEIDFSVSNKILGGYGTVTITATTPNIIGTFNFVCIDSTNVTNGIFTAIPLQ